MEGVKWAGECWPVLTLVSNTWGAYVHRTQFTYNKKSSCNWSGWVLLWTELGEEVTWVRWHGGQMGWLRHTAHGALWPGWPA